MSLLLAALGSVLVTIALTNRLPRWSRRSSRGRLPRPYTVSARLTERGRATLTTLGGSMLIAAFFLTLSGR
ncbi:hypothetical protein [Thermobifida cellulosilytica]|uniref:Uncharacterized protein n=1 Tax=Thermobifida cellulosilytica TB100 TaxID=665004 RepID=A0A147KM93_THECS|nr:hypothetical protein [Thermobifida cellulosilytica]KUP98424.1 hypothetical protein AC529_01580 [Thermobifida cellulosilytica TB100]